jgi:hypothetical protein
MKINIIAVLAFLILPLRLIASSQEPDYIIFNNDTIPTYNLIVEQFLQKKEKDKGQLFGLSFRNPIDGSSGSSFNCWRGYQAIYKFENDSLFVVDIINCHSIKYFNKQTSKKYLAEIFGTKIKNNKVFVDWFSGIISFPSKKDKNKMLRWDRLFERTFLFETVLTIENGTVIKISNEENYTDIENGIERLERDSINKILFERVKNYPWKKLDKIDCSEKYIITINEDGKVGNVRMALSDKLIKVYFTKREYNHCITSIKKALSSLQFDIIKRKGIPIKEDIILEIWIEENGTIENRY